jgi:glycerol uptake facilitator-like aquaporin
MWAIMATAVDPRGNRDWAPYAIGPIVGALLAAALYTEIVLKPQERIEQRPIDTLS